MQLDVRWTYGRAIHFVEFYLLKLWDGRSAYNEYAQNYEYIYFDFFSYLPASYLSLYATNNWVITGMKMACRLSGAHPISNLNKCYLLTSTWTNGMIFGIHFVTIWMFQLQGHSSHWKAKVTMMLTSSSLVAPVPPVPPVKTKLPSWWFSVLSASFYREQYGTQAVLTPWIIS